MDIKLPCGAVICTNNEEIANQLLKHGGVEYKATVKTDKADKSRKTVNKSTDE